MKAMKIIDRGKKALKERGCRRTLFFLLGLGMVLPYLSCKPSPPAPEESKPTFSPDTVARVEYVIDGDTIILENGEKIRFLGINAPEIRKRHGGSYQGMDQPWGRDAANYLFRLLPEGEEVGLKYDAERKDKYGRTLAYVILRGELVNGRLLEEGYARFADYGNELEYEEYLRKEEGGARARKRGVWGETEGRFKPPPYYISGRREEYFHRPDCPAALRIRPEERFRVTREEALRLDLKPHPACLGEEASPD
jgi:micrococcal nuclease